MNNKLVKVMLALVLGLTATLAQAQSATDEAQSEGVVSQALQKSMDPAVWTKLMNSMMSGELQGQPMIASCVECHTDEDIARYQKDFGGMMHAMNPMMQMANPQFYGNAASGMMNPMTGMMMAPMGMMTPMMMAPMGMMSPMMMPMTGMMMPGMGMPGMPGMPGMGMPPMPGMPGMGMPPMPGMPGMGMPPMPGMPGMGMPSMPGMPGMGMPSMPGMPPMGAPGMPGMPPIGAPAMPGMPPMGMMPPMPGTGAAPGAAGTPGIMDPKQYEQFYQQWTDMMSKMAPQQPAPETAESQ